MSKVKLFDDINNKPSETLEAIKRILPDCFDIDGNLMEDKLKDVLKGEFVQPAVERFTFNWAGKQKAREVAYKNYTDATLELDEKRSKNADTTKNLIIEGDNLQVLKLLQKSYRKKVKCIYIDPPYNTGNDFVYNDKFELDIKKYLVETGEIDEESGESTVEYVEKDNGKKHSKWLSFMYPRLVMAKEMLREDGVIFVSIDDNEVHHLRIMMNEIFGEGEFVASFIWQKHKAPKNDNKYITINHDYIIMFAKDKSSYEQILLSRSQDNINSFKNPDNDPRGVWSSGPLLAPTFSSSAVFSIISPITKKETLPPKGKCWSFSKTKITELINENRIWFGRDGNNVPRIKRFLSELRDGVVPTNMLLHDDIGGNQMASNDLQSLFINQKLFDYPKPVSLIKHLLKISTKPGDLVLDFFAGSGTTGQAVMELNEEDGKECNRQFILVQLPEEIDKKKEAYKAGYKKISDITIERVKRAGDKYQNVDTGFKVLKLTDNPQTDSLFDMSSKDNKFIFTHIALYYGYGLNYTVEKIHEKEIYLMKAEIANTKDAIFIMEKAPITSKDILNLVNNYGEGDYKFFSRDCALNLELTYNILQHFQKESVTVF